MKKLTRREIDPTLVRGLRERLRLTPDQFAAKFPVHRKTIWRWEQGKSIPSPVYLRQMYQIWGFSFGKQVEEDR